jgi:hypothetical protein
MPLQTLSLLAFVVFPIIMITEILMLAGIKALIARLVIANANLVTLISARDAEITALKAQIETLQAAEVELPTVEADLAAAVAATEALAPAA